MKSAVLELTDAPKRERPLARAQAIAETTAEELAEKFGDGVCSLVLEITDHRNLEKIERKRLQVLKAPTKSPHAKVIKVADKVANLRDLRAAPPGLE